LKWLKVIFLKFQDLNSLIKNFAGNEKQKPLIGEKVKDISQLVAVDLVELGVPAAGAGKRGEFPVLNVEKFCEEAAGGSHFTHFVVAVAAFWAGVLRFMRSKALNKVFFFK